VLVGRGSDDGPGTAGDERLNVNAGGVDRHVPDAQVCCGDCSLDLACFCAVIAGILERYAGHSGPGQRAQHQDQALPESGADDQPVLVSVGRADSTQVTGEYLAQNRAAARVPVIQFRSWGAAAGFASCPGPVAAGKARQIGHAGTEVRYQGRRRDRYSRRARGRRMCSCGDPSGRAWVTGQVALGQQLAAALLDEATGHAELTS